MPGTPRVTGPLLKVLDLIMRRPADKFYGYDIAKSADLKSGTLYPILARLEKSGWLQSGWETDLPEGRPPRRYYELTPSGRAGAAAILDDLPGRRPSTVPH